MTPALSTANYSVDGLEPESVLSPGSVEELSSVLAEAHRSREAVIPFGGGTRMSMGNVPARYTVALDLTSLSGSMVHEAGDLTLFADAGCRIADIQSLLAQNGQRLPFDVRSPERATLGGSVASNATGQMSSASGGIRDWIIGIRVVLADGTVTKSGGKVVKNVQGYDLHRLHTGAFGTLGVIAEVALKVLPIPADECTVAAWFDSVAAAGEFTLQVINGPALPEALTIFTGKNAESGLSSINAPAGEGDVLVLGRVAGGAKAVARTRDDLTRLAGAVGASGYEVLQQVESDKTWRAATSFVPEVNLSVRSVLRPTDALKLLDQASNEEAGAELQAGFGSVSVGWHQDDNEVDRISQFRSYSSEFVGKTVVERCSTETKKQVDVFDEQGPELAVARSIKQKFDENRVLNPGRFAGRI